MRDSCTKCKALSVAGGAPSCKLGHPINSKTTTPAEPCERPLTYLAFNEACRLYTCGEYEEGE